MATARSGSLVEAIRGSVGGVVFKQSKGQTIMAVRTKPTERSTSNQAGARALMRAAAIAWRGETSATKQAWEALAAWMSRAAGTGGWRYANGYACYIANWVAQQGAAAPVQAVPPLNFSLRGRDGLRYVNQGGAVYLDGLSRELLTDERLLMTIMVPVRAGLKNPPKVVRGYLEVPPEIGLGPVLDQCLVLGTPAAAPYRIGTYLATTDWSVEFWLKPTTATPPVWSMFFSTNNDNSWWGMGSSTVIWYAGGGYITWPGVTLTAGVWHHLALVQTTGGTNVGFFLDGHLVGVRQTRPPSALNTKFYVGVQSDGSGSFPGSIDEIRVSNFVQSEAQVLATWNAGVPKKLLVESGTIGLYHCDSVVGTVLTDFSGTGRHMTVAAPVQAVGALSPLIVPAGVWPGPGSGVLRVVSRMGVAGLWFQGQVDVNIPL
jgi:hypothetical protein